MSKFKVGDMVACYTDPSARNALTQYRNRGEVIATHDHDIITVRINGSNYLFHEKQCRRLVKKKRREFFANLDVNDNILTVWKTEYDAMSFDEGITAIKGIRFIEAKEQK